MDKTNMYQIKEIRIDNNYRLGDLYWNGTSLYLLVKKGKKVHTILVDDLIKELTSNLPPDGPVPVA